MSLEAPARHAPKTGRTTGTGRPSLPAPALWVAGALALVVLAVVVVLWGKARPGYDPYGWLVWGKLTIHWQLDTNGAPSWKPLPFLFTVPYALSGHYALWLWMVTAVSISLAGVVFAWRIAFRLTSDATHSRVAAHAAGLFAAIALLGIGDYSHFILSSQSDTMIVSLCLMAIDCQLCGRLRWALWLWVLAALGRPEAWPFLGLYGLWCWRTVPAMRRAVAIAFAVIPVLWFGIPALTAKSWFVAGDNALHSPRELHQGKVYGTIDRFLDLHETTVWVAALLCAAIAVWRRQKAILLLVAGVLTWLVVEIAFVLHGWPGVPRYLFEPAGVVAVVAAVFIGQLVAELTRLLGRAGRAVGLGARPALAAGVAVVAVTGALLVPLAPAVQTRWNIESKDLVHERARTLSFARLKTVVNRLGTGRMLACAKPNIPIGYQSVFAWYLGIKTGVLYVNQGEQRIHPTPVLNFLPIPGGWKVFPGNLDAAAAARCRGMTLTLQFRGQQT